MMLRRNLRLFPGLCIDFDRGPRPPHHVAGGLLHHVLSHHVPVLALVVDGRVGGDLGVAVRRHDQLVQVFGVDHVRCAALRGSS